MWVTHLTFRKKFQKNKNLPKKKKNISIQWWGDFSFWGELSFILSFLFFFSASTVTANIFTAPACKATIISLEPYALNADFQHFIPKFNKIFLLYGYPFERRSFGGERRPKDKVTLQIIFVFRLTCPKTFTRGHVSVFDKYLYWPCVRVFKKKHCNWIGVGVKKLDM